MMRLLALIVRTLAKPFLWIGASLIPKKPGLVVFSQSKGRYSDNSRALFEWMTVHSGQTLVWLYSGQRPSPVLPEDKPAHFTKRDTLAGVWFALRADVTVISHGMNDFGLLKHGIRRSKILVLWHAIMIKSSGLTDQKLNAHKKQRYIEKESCHFHAIISSSEVDRYHTAAYTGMNINQVHVTGLPRHDEVYAAKLEHKPRTEGACRILYAPTFRDNPGEVATLFFPFPDYDEAGLTEALRQANLQIWLRPHPNDTASVSHAKTLASKAPEVFVLATAQEYPDANVLLASMERIITDYSSIYLDLLPFDIPCLFVPFDIEKYHTERGLAYDYDLVAAGPQLLSQSDLIHHLQSDLSQWQAQRSFVRQMLLKYVDGQSCARVSALIDQMVRH